MASLSQMYRSVPGFGFSACSARQVPPTRSLLTGSQYKYSTYFSDIFQMMAQTANITVNAEASYKMRGVCLQLVIGIMSFLIFLTFQFSASSVQIPFASQLCGKKMTTELEKKKLKHGQETDLITVASWRTWILSSTVPKTGSSLFHEDALTQINEE